MSRSHFGQLSPSIACHYRLDSDFLFPFSLSHHSASEFCKSSARSLVAHYLDGALPCHCDQSGSTSPTCEPIGGQCHCRPHVIGRQCSRCATGFYGFPYCRRERPLLDNLHTAFTCSSNFHCLFLFHIYLIYCKKKQTCITSVPSVYDLISDCAAIIIIILHFYHKKQLKKKIVPYLKPHIVNIKQCNIKWCAVVGK